MKKSHRDCSQWRRWMSVAVLGVSLVGCSSVQYSDPVNPKTPYSFPGPTAGTDVKPAVSSTPAAGTAQAAVPATPVVTPAPAPATPVVAPAPTPVTPVTPVTTPAVAVPATPATAQPVSKLGPNSPDLSSSILRAGDSILITFADLPPPGLQPHALELGADGKLSLPLNVSVHALGKTARQLEQEIRSEYVPKYYKYLTVTVKTEQRFFHVGGEVKVPAQYPYRGDSSVVRAIQAAGGFTEWARKWQVQLTRANGQKFEIDFEKAVKDPTRDLSVYPGDYVIVPRKKWYGR